MAIVSNTQTLLFLFYFIVACRGTVLKRWPVYIESTDAFGMMFYATMPVLVERSLQVEQGSDALLQSFKLMKLKSPARLGDVLELSCDNGNIKCISQNSEVIFTATKAVLRTNQEDEEEEEEEEEEEAETEEVVGQHTSAFVLFPDEVGAGGALSTRTIFNLFERGRTDVLGGPSQLAAAQSSNNHVYVARISNYNRRRSQQGSGALRPSSVQVISQTEPVGDSIVEFTQFCVVDGALSASAKITCCSVDANTGLPAPFRQILRDKLFPSGSLNR